jgi:hypothetical protein
MAEDPKLTLLGKKTMFSAFLLIPYQFWRQWIEVSPQNDSEKV